MDMHILFDQNGHALRASFDPIKGAQLVALPENVALPDRFLAAHRWTGKAWVRRDPEPDPAPPPRDLGEAKAEALQRITAAVQDVRLRLVTPLPGQDAIYTAKQAEAARYVAAQPEPATLAEFPFLRAEVGITAPTARELAQLWLNMAHLFAVVGAATEGARKAAEAAIAGARDVEAVDKAEADFAAALAGLVLP